MSRHPADHCAPSDGSRAKHFLRLARDSGAVWRLLWKKPRIVSSEGRRMAEFLRIDRGRQA